MQGSTISQAVQRAETILTESPELGLRPDPPATAIWTGGLATRTRHPDGRHVHTDMPTSLGGGGAEVTPGWLMRAALASCTATVIVMRAERLGIALEQLEVTTRTVSDARGMLAVHPNVGAGPLKVELVVVIRAAGVDPDSLEKLVAWADEHSPVGTALRESLDVRLTVNPATK